MVVAVIVVDAGVGVVVNDGSVCGAPFGSVIITDAAVEEVVVLVVLRGCSGELGIILHWWSVVDDGGNT